MANKIIFIGLIVALFQVTSAEEANPKPYMDDVSRMSAEIKATEERCTQKVSKLERILEDFINLQTNSSILHKRAELACLKTYDLRSAGIHNNTIPYKVQLVTANGNRIHCGGVLIEKRFVLSTLLMAAYKKHDILEFSFSDKVVSKNVKKLHFHPIGRLNSFILVELDSDVDYNYWLYPTCLYTSELNPNSGLMHDGKTMEIAEDSNCFRSDSKKLRPFEMCVDGGCSFSDNLVFLVEEETKPQLFGLLKPNCYGKYRSLRKVFPDLDFIENIVWPKNGN